jgi:hypothetical protein
MHPFKHTFRLYFGGKNGPYPFDWLRALLDSVVETVCLVRIITVLKTTVQEQNYFLFNA